MRQGEINKGFDVLRERIPHPVLSKGRCEKLRKIDILHVAISYIRALENILESGEAGINEFANSLYSVVSSTSSSSSSSLLAEGPSSPAHEARTQSPESCSPSSSSSSASPASLPPLCKVEVDLSPPTSTLLEKRRQKVVFQNRAHFSSG